MGASVAEPAKEIEVGIDGRLTIGQVVSHLKDEFPDLTGSKIRFLEERKLIKLARTVAGYRVFNSHDVEVLRWILTCQRDNYLPLNVIAGRIERGEHLADMWDHPMPQTAEELADSEPADSAATNSVVAAEPVQAKAEQATESEQATGEQTTPPASENLPLTPADDSRTQNNVHSSDEQTSDKQTSAQVKLYTTDELCVASGLEPAQVAELIDFGILPVVAPTATQSRQLEGQGQLIDNQCFSEEALVLARVAREFATHGLQPRHLRILCNAAERDAAMFIQGLQPLLYARDSDANDGATRAGERLLDLCERMRGVVMRSAMSQILE